MLASKISRFPMFYNTPLFHPYQNPPTYPLFNAHKYCKMFFSGGLTHADKAGELITHLGGHPSLSIAQSYIQNYSC